MAALLDAPEPHIRLRAARVLFANCLRLRDEVDTDTVIHDLRAVIEEKIGPLD